MSPQNDAGGGGSGGGQGQGGGRRRRRRRKPGGGGGQGGGNRQQASGRKPKRGPKKPARARGRGKPGGRGRGGGGGGGGGAKTQAWNQKQPVYLSGGEHSEDADGIAEVYRDGSAYLRRSRFSLLAQHDDIYVPQNLVRQYNIGQGSRVIGKMDSPELAALRDAQEREAEDAEDARDDAQGDGADGADAQTSADAHAGGDAAESMDDDRRGRRGRRGNRQRGNREKRVNRPTLVSIESIDDTDPDEYKLRVPFKHLTTIDPERWMQLEGDGTDATTRVMDLLAPIGFGQRYLIVAPPRAGKTVVLQKLGAALNSYYPDVEVFVLLINERPEEVTDMKRSIKGEVIASSLDDLAPSHIAVAEMCFARAQRLVEQDKDVVVLVDSLTRMARAYNMEIGGSSRTLSGGLDSRAMEHPKRHFGCARNVEGGGSLTVVATALVDTGSRMDQVIFEEFKGTGNAELVLSRKLAEMRIYPAMDISKSGTRKEEKILPEDILKMTWTLRRVLNQLKPVEAMELLVDKLEATPTNRSFLEHFRID